MKNSKSTHLLIKNSTMRLVIVTMAVLLTCCKKEPEYLSYADLVNRLTDLRSLAELPRQGEKSAMWSSYDRASKIDSVTGEFINWDANIDGLKPQYIRKESENEVLAEMTGPGAIVRIWSASPGKGKVKIYIDGNKTPIINESFIDYFKPSIPAFDYSELVYETDARGFNNYVPIPYQKSCKVVAEPGWGQYYHFNYITFPNNTQLEPFKTDPLNDGAKALERVNTFFDRHMGTHPEKKQNPQKETSTVTLKKGERKTVFLLEGEGAIASLKARLNFNTNGNDNEMFRKTILQIRWDEEESPSVWSPLGDFFGTSPGLNEYRTMPMGMTKKWMYSYWYMPFGQGAQITLQNFAKNEVSVTLELEKEKLSKGIEYYGRFHAKWHRDLEPVAEERWPDWRLLHTKGRGRFIGTHLLVWNPKGGSAATGGPGYWWWGEGDEKFFVDGERFPSTFGTGTEDYFGYAWCDPSFFEQAFHSQTQDNDNMGYQPMNRWQVTDNVPFQFSFDGYLEKYFPNTHPTQYSTVVYWYLNQGGEDPLKAVAPEQLYGYETLYHVFRATNAIEGEHMKVINNSGGWASNDVWANETLFETTSGHKILQWFTVKNKSNQLHLEFNWQEAGIFEVYANVIKQEDGGAFKATINDKPLLDVDCSSTNGNKSTHHVRLGRVRLQPGKQRLRLIPLEKQDPPKALRLDYVEFKKVK